MKQVAVRLRLQDSIAAEPTDHLVENVLREDGSTQLDLLVAALKNLSLSLGDVDLLRPPTMRDAGGATLETADWVSPVTDGVTYEFALVKRASDVQAIGQNSNGNALSQDLSEVLGATELDASAGNKGSRSIASRIGRGIAASGRGIVAASNWVRNRLVSGDKPIEVIGVQQRQLDLNSEKKWPQMVLNTKGLTQILRGNDVDARGLPVAIVGITGLFRSGKSFILNFFLRYLSHMEAVAAGHASPDDDWFEPISDDDSTEHDRFHWDAGRKGVTKGICFWPKSFVLRRSNGEKIAVVLMDSQGTEDLKSSNEECVAVFALSTMIASLQIYNVKENINKQTLTRLQELTQFANEAFGRNQGDSKHFQSLVFLIRDSNQGSGFDIGKSEVEEALEEDVTRQVGEDLKQSFEEISGFLMLHPGNIIHMGLKDRRRTYKNVLEAMEPGFKLNVKDFTQTMLNPDTLRTKQVKGETVTCDIAVNYIKKWTEAFRDCRMPSPKLVGDATAEVTNLRAVECAVKAYDRHMQDRFNNAERPYPVAELQQIHEAALEGARETFADKCMGKDRHKAPHLQKMGKLIAVEHAAFKKANANLAVPIANNVYVAFWNDFIASEKHDWSHYHLKQDAFADKDGQHRNAAVKKFNEFAVKDEESSRDALKKLEHMLKISMLKRKVVNGVKCYKHHMTTAQNSVEPWITSRLQSCHKEAKKQAVDEADLSRWARDGEFAMAREDLKRQIKVAKASFIPPDMPGDKNSNAWDQAIAHYIKRMDRICKPYETPYVEANVFIQENARYIDEAKALFEDRCAKDGQTDEFRKTLLQELARQQVEFEKVNSKNWWWDGWKTVSTLVGSVYDDCMHLLGFD